MRPSFASIEEFDETSTTRDSDMQVLKDVCSPGKVPIPKTGRTSFRRLEESEAKFLRVKEDGTHDVGYRTKGDAQKGHTGIAADISIYNPILKNNYQASGAAISIQSGPENELNIIKIGWVSDNYASTGCYNLHCHGFVVVDSYVPIDSSVYGNLSVTGGRNYEANFALLLDKPTGNWWYYLGNNHVALGYWPKELFPHLSNGADSMKMGGFVYLPPAGDYDYPQMGCGRKMKRGRTLNDEWRDTSHFSRIQFRNEALQVVDPDVANLETIEYRCYYVAHWENRKDVGYSFLFTGRGTIRRKRIWGFRGFRECLD
ncbi:hypothetical protein IFM89_039397 [Coptis chinensis]|uniref:Neprosin PEP catalytic domain-containing protein n=1 Tax=Coptis chinensis TaxID=261450 RepID=A0A835M6E7_9MAGN|nr:hypothetical protein IFM89_039397 [Coptis chinensis]